MTDKELDALVSEIAKLAWSNADVATAAITTLRTQLAEVQAKLAVSNEIGLALEEDAGQQRARANRAEAALAAQIEADAGICADLYLAALRDSDNDLSSPWKSHKASAYGTALQAIRNQPHDRTALDRMLAEAEARGYQFAADEAKRSGWHLRRYDLAKRDAELAKP